MKTSDWKPKFNDQDKVERRSTDNQTVAISDQNTNSAFSLQRSLGNQATKELYQANSDAIKQSKNFQPKFRDAARQHQVQAKLQLSVPGDKYEQEADKVADRVMRGDKLNETVQPKLQVKERTTPELTQKPTGINSEFVNRLDRTHSQGHVIDESVRHTIEQQMPYSFDKVRIHTDSNAAQMNQAIGARAFTYGQNIYLGAGQYRPDTQRGRHLLVHELTHTVQQRNAPLDIVSRQTDSPDEQPPLETRVENAITALRGAGANLNNPRQQDLLSATVSVLSEFIPQGFGTKDAQGAVQNASRSVPVRQPVATVGDYMHQVTLYLSQENRGAVAGEYIGQQGQGAIILYAPNLDNASAEDIAETLVHETVHLFSDILRRAVIWARRQRRTGTSTSPAPTTNSTGSLSLNIELAGLRASTNRPVEEAILRLGRRYEAIIRFINVHRRQRNSEPLNVGSEATRWASITLDEMLAYVFAERVVQSLTSQPRPSTQPSGPTGIVSMFDPTRFFYAYALDHWVNDSDDRSRLESPEGRQVMQRVGQSRELESLYTFVMQWINQT